jgi:hypothetical protein
MLLNPFYSVYKKWFSSDRLEDRKTIESIDYVHQFQNLTDSWTKKTFKVQHGMDFTCLEIRLNLDSDYPPLFKIEDGSSGEIVFSYNEKDSFVDSSLYAGPGTIQNGVLTEPKFFRWVFGSDGIIVLKAKKNPKSNANDDGLNCLVSGVQFKMDGSTID